MLSPTRHPLLDTGTALYYRDSNMAQPNFKNRTLWTGDNLDIMRGLNSETVDLIYLDPPFNSNRDYSAPIGSEAAGAAFKDTWALSDVDLALHGLIAEENPALYAIIDAAGMARGKGMKSYLIMMAVRLLEMKRILKPTGSVYLHCDPTASHYLKTVMDAIFGSSLFQAEINWQRFFAHSDSRTFGNVSDKILFYSVSPINSDAIRTALAPEYVNSHYRYTDKRGRYQDVSLTGPSHGSPPGSASTLPWRDYDPAAINRIWSVPKTGKYADWIDCNILSGYRNIESIFDRLDALDQADMLIYTQRGHVPRLKRYLNANPGQVPSNNWTDISPVNSQAKERTGYPTQKPIALLERIIKASSNEGDVVLDPFAGCATALIAAEKLERQWIGIDLSPVARTLVQRRMAKELGFDSLGVIYRDDTPKRTDMGVLPPYQTHKHTLYGMQEGICIGCEVLFPFRNFTVDHIVPKARGGTDHIENLQLLCGACNSVKGTKTQEEFLVALRGR